MGRRKKPLVNGAESALDALRREIQTQSQPSRPSYSDRFRELARKVAEDIENQDQTH